MTKDNKKPRQITLGAAATPLPVWDPQTGMTGALAGSSSGITFHTLHEDRADATAAEFIYADLMRNLPSRSMLPHLLHELTERDPGRVDWDKHSFLCGYMGPPSIGKSYMIKTVGRLTHPRGCLYLNCKDVDMGTIFCETVFDTSSANREKAAIDAKILQGNQGGKGLSEDSLRMLRNALGDAYAEEKQGGNTVISIDWNGIQVKGDTPEEQNYHKQVIREAISQVCHNEGIVMTADAGQIGITTRDGIAIRAADPKSADYGRPVLLDEINRAKPGTLQKLYEFFAMLSDPKVDRLQVVGGENRPFTFHRRDLPVTFRMNFTGNPAGRAMGSADMDRPLISRFGVELDIRTVPDPAHHDYADRISQTLTGVPLTQLYYSAKPWFDANPEKLAEVAKTYRLKGLSPKEAQNVPEEELLNISQAYRTLQVSEQLAEFFASVKNVFNPESQLYRGSNFSISQEYESYLMGVEIDLRLVTKLIEKASVVSPKVLQPGTVDYSAAFSRAADKNQAAGIDDEDRLADRGRRLEAYLLQWMHQVLVPADMQSRNIRPDECQKVLRVAKTIAAHCGIGEMNLKESLKGDIKRIGELYDFDKLEAPEARSALLRDLFTENLGNLSEDGKAMITPDTAPQFAQVYAQAGIQTTEEDADGELVNRDLFLTLLAAPKAREEALKALWRENLADLEHIEPSDEAFRIAAGTSKTGVALATVELGGKTGSEIVHILRAPANDNKPETVLVVSDTVDKRIRSLLKSSGVTFVDRNDIEAPKAAASAIDRALDGREDAEKVKKTLSAAFLMRNGAAGEEAAHAAKPIADLITGGSSVPATAPLRVIKRKDGGPKAA